MSSPSSLAAAVAREALKLLADIHSLRYKYAKAMLSKLTSAASTEPWVVEVSGYQTYIWLPGKKQEFRVLPYSLTAKVQSWLTTRPYAPQEPPIVVNWNEVFEKLKANFRLKTVVFESIKELLDMLTAAEIETEEIEFEEWAGRVQFGEFSGVYKIDADGIKIAYLETVTGKVEKVTIATSETSGCTAKQILINLLKDTTSGIDVKCQTGLKKVNYMNWVCSDLDQLVTYIRQLLDKQVYCITYKAKHILFLDGPLAGLTWNMDAQPEFIFYDGSKATVVDLESLVQQVRTAKSLCANSMSKYVCT